MDNDIKRKKHRKRKRKAIFRRMLFRLFLLVAIIFLAYFSKNFAFDFIQGSSEVGTLTQSVKTDGFGSRTYKFISETKEDLSKGNLILVNPSLSYEFSMDSELSNLFEQKNTAYKVSKRNIMLNQRTIEALNRMLKDFQKASSNENATIISGYRTADYQQQLLDTKTKNVGEKEALRWVAKPNYSEHHTGLAIDFGVLTEKGNIQDFDGSGSYSWIGENCGNYGFIKRYVGEKEKITGIADEPWHFRYVGLPHGNLIKKNGYCLEEYIEYLKEFEFKKKHLLVKDFDGEKYEIYYVKTESGKIRVPVPKNKSYDISGNNEDGFIVTIRE